ncbi:MULTISPECIES: transglutaminase-like domain-containing protein [Tenacibaculum]|uniref:transglutaminase-like domain-containing protein n=1 Tax=Tenacibaculum TaxID=104267 RepID=UPI001F26E9E7|nr:MULTISPECIES: transglutaminase family protein [Tenacibaculum]MCF2876457.1 transglutaminase family protein [Tenacibaculum sp. Cn5-1]MCF2936636.1 transglutaminase family protein [Tenacibaculum sp. Cn5-34]MCG7511771.1 transglutaminase family protein [Tenacibaculum sp. Cn5-46]
MKEYTTENFNFDFLHENLQNLLIEVDDNFKELTKKDFAIKAYYYVRDKWPYNPYRFSLIEEDWKSSLISTQKTGHCLDKAIIYISLLRSQDIPARLGLAKVKNHIAVEDIVEKFGNDVLVPHGYVELFLNDNWVKATPAFNQSLCEKLGVKALDFDGEHDSLFQEYDLSGNVNFMEYLEDYGTFKNVPLPYMFQLMQETYPPLQKSGVNLGIVLNLAAL